MFLFVPRETEPDETRAALVPEGVRKLVGAGIDVAVESSLGLACGHLDEAFADAGSVVRSDRAAALAEADVVARVRKPPADEVGTLKRGAVHISFLDPFNERGLVESLAQAGISTISMEMVPRTTRAQKMDALSSQASLAGYVAVIIGAERLGKILPMMMTPAGTIAPSRVFVIGAGVAGLQAIATAKRLGAHVDAFDTRPVVEEQVRSLGGRFVKVDLGETGQTKDGYAKELTPDQQQRQREAMAKVCAGADLVITTAQLFGKKAPVIVTSEMVRAMRPGSVVVDLAIETGGNVECAELGREIDYHGVRIVGIPNLPGRAPVHASQMYSANVTALLSEYWKKDSKEFALNQEDEIIQGCLVTHQGNIVNERIRQIYAGS